jgi:hypothetical protein
MSFIKRWSDAIIAFLLWGLCLVVLLRTLVPTLYTLDSAEFVLGARTLGIVHAPGYPLYLLLLHLFLQLPFPDSGYASNLFSALWLSMLAPLLYTFIRLWLTDRRVAIITALILIWSYYIWLIGLFAEVYAPQLTSLALVGVLLIVHWRRPHPFLPYIIAVAFGFAVALNPSSIFFVPALVITFRALQIGWSVSIQAGLLALAVFALPLLYFPVRYLAAPNPNLAGMYDATGVFQAVDLTTLSGIWWMLSGRQFGSLFFADGLLPSLDQLLTILALYIRNFAGIGVVFGIGGLFALVRQHKQIAWVWLVWFLPYTYFYTTYGAGDKDLMFGPSILLWSIPIAFGLSSLIRWIDIPWFPYTLFLIPFILLMVYFPLLDLTQERQVRARSEAVLAALPQNTYLFGGWHDIVPIEYIHYVEGKRPDLTLYNLFLFEDMTLESYVNKLITQGQTVAFVVTRPDTYSLVNYNWTNLLQNYRLDIQLVAGHNPDDLPVEIYMLLPSSPD